MPVSKYDTDTVKAICDALATNGLDRYGWEAGAISEQTFYKWLKTYPEFKEAVNQARSDYRKLNRNSLEREAGNALWEYLTGSMTRTESTVTYHPDGERTEVVKTIPVGKPRWAIERILGKPLHEVEIVSAAAEKGFIPKWVVQYAISLYREIPTKVGAAIRGELPDSEIQEWIEAQELATEAATDGISDETWNRIRSQVIGVRENADGYASIPTEIHHESVTSSDNSQE